MRVVLWVLGLIVALLVALFLHYVLPKREVVYITSTENRIVEAGEYRGIRALGEVDAAAGTGAAIGADVFFVNTTRPDGSVLVLRNEDTGLGFPPYFKFDSANVQAEAQDAVSTRDNPRWVVVRYYGWRVPFMSMFPNLTSIAPATGPDMTLIPWFTIVLLVLALLVLWAVWARVRRWRRRRADPVVASWETPAVVPRRRSWFFGR